MNEQPQDPQPQQKSESVIRFEQMSQRYAQAIVAEISSEGGNINPLSLLITQKIQGAQIAAFGAAMKALDIDVDAIQDVATNIMGENVKKILEKVSKPQIQIATSLQKQGR